MHSDFLIYDFVGLFLKYRGKIGGEYDTIIYTTEFDVISVTGSLPFVDMLFQNRVVEICGYQLHDFRTNN